MQCSWTIMDDILKSNFLALLDCIFNQANIENTLLHLAEYVTISPPHDLVYVAQVMLQDTICIAFSEKGFCPYQRDTSIIFEYSKMTAHQLTVMQEFLLYITDNNYIMYSPKSQGVYMYMCECGVEAKVDAGLVIFATCVNLYASNRRQNHIDFGVLCNIILNRLTASAQIPQTCRVQGVAMAQAQVANERK